MPILSSIYQLILIFIYGMALGCFSVLLFYVYVADLRADFVDESTGCREDVGALATESLCVTTLLPYI